MLDRFLEENRLVIEKQFTEGSRCQGVYLVKKDHTPMILKISDIPSEMAEIERNLTGYRSTQELGLDFFVPEMFLAGQQGKFTFILMEYLGENFKSFMLRAGGIKDYMVLINCLRRVYQKSIHKINHEVLANQLDIFRELLKTSKHDSMANYPIREIDLERLIHMFDFTLRHFMNALVCTKICQRHRPSNRPKRQRRRQRLQRIGRMMKAQCPFELKSFHLLLQ